MTILSYFFDAREAHAKDDLDGFLQESGLSEEDQAALRAMVTVSGPTTNQPPVETPMSSSPSGIYQNYLQKMRDSDWEDETIKSIDESVRETARRMGKRNPVTRPGYGMVIGRIQSGKTAHMIGLLLLSIDSSESENPYDTVIVLSGLINDLRLQTRRRVESATTPFAGEGATVVPGPEADLSSADEDTLNLLSEILSGHGTTPIVVIKKNHIVLAHLLSCLPSETDSFSKRVLIIDDEADHASVDTGGEEEEDNSGEGHIDNPSETNRKLRQIIARLRNSKACWYLGYTATPFANLLSLPGMGDAADQYGPSLHPRDMLQVLSKPEGHLDNEQFFLNAESANILPAEVSAEGSVEERREFRDVICRHILTHELKKLRGIEGHHTTLIHTSINVENHRREAILVRSIIEDMKHPIEMDHTLSAMERLVREYSLPPEENGKILERIRQLLTHDHQEFVEIIGQIEAVEVNSRKREEGEESEKNLDYEGPNRSYIAVGGTRLSRGLTLEGLTTSWFTRRASEPKYDTMLQQARWCGYRSAISQSGERVDYSDLVRILTTEEIRMDFIRITNEEIDLRSRIKALPEDANPLDHEIWIREHPGMKITREGAMADAISTPWGNRIKSTIWSWDSPALGEKPGEKSTTIFNSAQKLISDAIDLSPKGPEQPPNKSSNFKLIREVYGTPVKEFLQTYLENLPNSSETRANLRGLLTEWDLRKNLDSWNIAIHTPTTDTKPVEISGLKIGLVNRSSTPAGKIGYIQNSGEDTQLDVHEDEHVRETPLLLLYLVKPSSTIRDEGQERVFHPDVKQPIPIFGVCLPTNLTEEGGTAWTADKSDL